MYGLHDRGGVSKMMFQLLEGGGPEKDILLLDRGSGQKCSCCKTSGGFPQNDVCVTGQGTGGGFQIMMCAPQEGGIPENVFRAARRGVCVENHVVPQDLG